MWARDPWSARDMSTYHNLCSPEYGDDNKGDYIDNDGNDGDVDGDEDNYFDGDDDDDILRATALVGGPFE